MANCAQLATPAAEKIATPLVVFERYHVQRRAPHLFSLRLAKHLRDNSCPAESMTRSRKHYFMHPQDIYKILQDDQWQQAKVTGFFAGSEDDLRDGFIHLSTGLQVEDTLAKHFSHQSGLIIVAFSSADLIENLTWEPSRGGALFPHYYGPLPTRLAHTEKELLLDETGSHRKPDLLR